MWNFCKGLHAENMVFCENYLRMELSCMCIIIYEQCSARVLYVLQSRQTKCPMTLSLGRT